MRRAWILSALAVLALACASEPNDASRPDLVLPDLDRQGFAEGVMPVLRSYCGTAECHGRRERGLRVFEDDVDGAYASAVGLDPQNMSAFLSNPARTADDARRLVLLTKPLSLERHGGGISLRRGEPAEECLVSWLLGNTNRARCQQAVATR